MMERKKTTFLFLNESDMIKAGVLDTVGCTRVMDEMFALIGRGDYIMSGHNKNSHGALITFPEKSPFPNMPLAGPDRRYMAMPAYLGGRFHMTGVKWYGSNTKNHEKGLPRSVLMVCLNDADTGEPVALMSANLLSSIRTGSVPGVAAKYLAREGAESVGIVGCGVISRSCVRAILNNMPGAKRVCLYDIYRDAAEKFRDEIKAEFDLEYIIKDDLKQCVVDADVISIAASGAVKVRVEEEWLKPGCLFTVTGHAEMDQEFFQNNAIVFDHWPMHKCWLEESLLHEDGIESIRETISTYPVLKMFHEGHIREEELHSLGDIVSGKVPARKNNDERILFISGGMPLEDVAWGFACYEEAVKQGLGQELCLWDGAYWA